jgi:hypothetical protein
VIARCRNRSRRRRRHAAAIGSGLSQPELVSLVRLVDRAIGLPREKDGAVRTGEPPRVGAGRARWLTAF